MQDKRCRAFFITSNNPDRHYEDVQLHYSTATEADYVKAVESAIKRFTDGDKNHEERDPAINGAVGVFEVGEQGTPHIHLLVCSKNPMRFSALQKRFPHSQIEVLRGSIAETLDYLHKRGKHEKKAETLRCQPAYWGDCFVDNRGLSGNGVFSAIEELLEDGNSPTDIYAQSPKYSFYASAIERTFNARRVSEIPVFRNLCCEYHCGHSGSGKTREYIRLCEKGLVEDVYFVSGDYRHPWDGYELQPILFVDEVRPTSFSTSQLLALTDGYRLTLPARYANKQAAWERVYIATVVPPEDLFFDSFAGASRSAKDTFDQFKRRLDVIVYHYVNPYLTGDEKYQTVRMAAKDYEGIQQLEQVALRKIEETGESHGQLRLPI